MADIPYEGSPGALQLVGATAEHQGLAIYEASPGALLLLGLTATVILPILRVLNPDLPSGVRGRARSLYPRLVVIYDKRYTVRSRQEELTLLNRLSDEKGKKEKKKVAPPKAPTKVRAKTVYTIRRR